MIHFLLFWLGLGFVCLIAEYIWTVATYKPDRRPYINEPR